MTNKPQNSNKNIIGPEYLHFIWHLRHLLGFISFNPTYRRLQKHIILVTVTFCLLFPEFTQAKSADKHLSDALYYQVLADYTSQLQIDYYKRFYSYLERTEAPGKPVLIAYYIGLAYFEMGKYDQAARYLKKSSINLSAPDLPPPIAAYKYYSQVMEAGSLYQKGQQSRPLEGLISKKKTKDQARFLGYILLRLNYRTDLAKRLLIDCPNNFFGEATYKWIRYKLGAPIENLKIAKFKLKRAEFEEKYDRLKLTKGGIALSIKYFNPAQISLLKEISLYRALNSYDKKDMENFAPMGQAHYLLGEYKTAISYLEDYQKAFPLDLSATILLGQCYYAVDQREKALQVWKWITQSGGRKIKRKLALVLSTVPEMQQDALLLIKKTKDKEISKNRRFDVSYYLKYKDYYQTLGRVYLHQQEFKDAADYFMLTYEKSRREQPRTYDRTYLLSMGYALAKTGRYRAAIDFSLKGASSLDLAAYPAFHAVNYGLSMLGYE